VERSGVLRSLHVPGEPLVLPNAWDAATAKVVAAAGFAVVATTSAGVAESLGYEDHQGAPVEEMLAAAERIVRAVDVPVTVDFEAGYGLAPAEIAAALERIGAAGCNLEDTDHETGGLRPVADQAAWLGEVRRASPELVINARIDVFLLKAGGVAEALERAHAYFDAGADCVYPIGLADHAAIAGFVEQAGGPVNVLVTGETPPRELADLGVARISFGSFFFRQGVDAFTRSLRALAG
jgi:2-methylisocitrate lyase-like PEP mutase family enzyme